MLGGLVQGVVSRVAFNVIIILGIAAVVLFLVSRAFRGRYDLRDKYLDEDQKSNAARSRDVEPEYFYTPDLTKLPLRNATDATDITDATDKTGEIKKKQDQLVSICDRLMIRFPKKMTNVELKNAYGVANLEKISGYEENYNQYVAALVEWAEALLENGQEANAIKILETTVELGSELRKGYMYLADYYTKKANATGLNFLLDRVAEIFTDEGIKLTLSKYIMDKKESL